MRRGLSVVAWGLFGIVSYLMLLLTVHPWVRLPGDGNTRLTAVFTLFSLVHCAALEGGRRFGLFFFASAAVTFVFEEVGVRTGWVFGAYHYGDLLGPKIGHVPVYIVLGWFMMIYPSWMVARAMLQGLDVRRWPGLVAQAGVAAAVMTGWDAVMDPGMVAEGQWTWERGGAYFGVPRHNFVGWMAASFAVYLIAGVICKAEGRARLRGRWFAALPVVVYAEFALRYMAENRIAALEVVALFSMGLPAALALMRTFGSAEGGDSFDPVARSSQRTR